MSELKADKTFVFGEECEAYKKSEADKVIADLEESHKMEVEQLLMEIVELKEKLKEQNSIAEERWNEFRTYHTSYAEAVKELYDKNKEIAELKADYKEACDRLQTANLIKDEQLAATRHQKYRRCLAMVKYCEAMRGHYLSYEEPKWFWYRVWSARWLELAEKFKDKEAK